MQTSTLVLQVGALEALGIALAAWWRALSEATVTPRILWPVVVVASLVVVPWAFWMAWRMRIELAVDVA